MTISFLHRKCLSYLYLLFSFTNKRVIGADLGLFCLRKCDKRQRVNPFFLMTQKWDRIEPDEMPENVHFVSVYFISFKLKPSLIFNETFLKSNHSLRI